MNGLFVKLGVCLSVRCPGVAQLSDSHPYSSKCV